MTKPNFKPAAVDFVRRHNCHTSTPVELVVKAMEEGAAMALSMSTTYLRDQFAEQEAHRVKMNLGA